MDFGCWVFHFGFWIFDFGRRFWGLGFWVLDVGMWVFGFGCWLLGHKGLGVEFLTGAPACGHCELKWKEPHESPKFVEFAMSALLPKATC